MRISDPGTGWAVTDVRELALRIRLRAVRMVAPQGFGYLGQALSSAEQVAAAFACARPGADRLVCSPGHYIIGPFAAAAELGLIDDLSGYGQNGSAFEAIGTERSPVVDYTCGSLGQGRALAELARNRGEILCLSGDLTKQTEVDLFQAEFPERFIHGGMAEANMMSMAGALARCGHIPFVHTFGVFATRRPFDQIANAIAYPNLPVRIVGFMPGLSTPGGPSHQAIDDVALMRVLPGMTVIDVADAVETRQVVPAIVDLPGPVYVRLKRGEIPVIFDDDHVLRLGRAEVVPPEASAR